MTCTPESDWHDWTENRRSFWNKFISKMHCTCRSNGLEVCNNRKLLWRIVNTSPKSDKKSETCLFYTNSIILNGLWRSNFYVQEGLNCGVDNEVPVGQLPDLHGSISSAWKESVLLIHKDLEDALADVFENTMSCMLIGKGVATLVAVHGPNLKRCHKIQLQPSCNPGSTRGCQ